MKSALTLLLFCVSAFAADPVQDVNAALNTWKAAMLKGDAATLTKLYHNDLSYTHSSALVEDKAAAIASATKAGGVAKAIDLESPSTHVYGNTAIVKVKGNFTSATGTTNHLDLLMVWLKTSQGWQTAGASGHQNPIEF